VVHHERAGGAVHGRVQHGRAVVIGSLIGEESEKGNIPLGQIDQLAGPHTRVKRSGKTGPLRWYWPEWLQRKEICFSYFLVLFSNELYLNSNDF
jgi:hypothetical protein